jgi:hypothetical protein
MREGKNCRRLKAKCTGSKKDEVINFRYYISVGFMIYVGRLELLQQQNLKDTIGGKCICDGEGKEFMQNFGRRTY